jgi:hypothetical protein
MDDILLSSEDDTILISSRTLLEAGIRESRFQLNETKSVGPLAEIEIFNINLSYRSIYISEARIEEFKAALLSATLDSREGILGYVGSINESQWNMLSKL